MRACSTVVSSPTARSGHRYKYRVRRTAGPQRRDQVLDSEHESEHEGRLRKKGFETSIRAQVLALARHEAAQRRRVLIGACKP